MGKVVTKTCGPEFKSHGVCERWTKHHRSAVLVSPWKDGRQKHENPLKDAGSCPGTCRDSLPRNKWEKRT